MTARAETKFPAPRIYGANLSAPVLFTTGPTMIGIRAGTVVEIDGNEHHFAQDTPVAPIADLVPGRDYGIGLLADGKPFAALAATPTPLDDGWFAGFHFAPGGNAPARAGGDTVPAINPFSLWDIGFRPSCPDPRGMAMIDVGGKRLWVDIYLLGIDHLDHGTSRCGAVIADGDSLPMRTDGQGSVKKLDYATATEIYAHHGKRLLGAEEFFAAACGVKERCSRSNEPTLTGALTDGAECFISRHGLFDATGTMWVWGADGDPDNPRPSVFGGCWLSGGDAGSRCASLDGWAEVSHGALSARGACDHLSPV